jgi:C_GCAxxG_C_C family probable redox protein
MEIKKVIGESVHQFYWENDYNCACTTMRVLSQLLGISLHRQVLDAGIGMHGAGCFGAQCGLVEGGLMFIGIYFSHQGKQAEEISTICYHFAADFQKRFGSIVCRDLRPGGFREDGPLHRCEELTKEAIQFTYEFIKMKES